MNFSTVAVVVVVVALAALALFNWPALSALSPVSLGLTQVQAPLGLLLLGLTAALGLLLFVHAVLQQTRAGAEARRHAKELSVQRELAAVVRIGIHCLRRHRNAHRRAGSGAARQGRRGDTHAVGLCRRGR